MELPLGGGWCDEVRYDGQLNEFEEEAVSGVWESAIADDKFWYRDPAESMAREYGRVVRGFPVEGD